MKEEETQMHIWNETVATSEDCAKSTAEKTSGGQEGTKIFIVVHFYMKDKRNGELYKTYIPSTNNLKYALQMLPEVQMKPKHLTRVTPRRL